LGDKTEKMGIGGKEKRGIIGVGKNKSE